VTYRVRLTRQAQADLQRLFDFIIERELASSTGDLEVAERALTAIRTGFDTLRAMPFTCRKAGDSPFLRELVISFGATGYVALFEIIDEQEVVIAAVRHQREDDYY
jgi:plasmid stabilization system protein ParE